MKIRLNADVFGLHIAGLSVDLDLDDAEAAPVSDRVVKAASRPVKGLSRFWVKGMMA
ncbi:hypothetical protein SEA_LASTHOPE_63 [Mycobacterium phage LastHope]|uniref:Uncharacterized protein n=1 Tax=Mycobacterium phage LastHope TaxID=2015886 RepID=A0A222ZSX8_9CAUD|nr:hypothetical protein I5G99_gp045 [Mycobacterium phage LastHope]ASR87231.1 hypothetical protein SEA_LASTHOPE_63 [Mycobacterium phage LastHope]